MYQKSIADDSILMLPILLLCGASALILSGCDVGDFFLEGETPLEGDGGDLGVVGGDDGSIGGSSGMDIPADDGGMAVPYPFQ
jgi:hypothetical protein